LVFSHELSLLPSWDSRGKEFKKKKAIEKILPVFEGLLSVVSVRSKGLNTLGLKLSRREGFLGSELSSQIGASPVVSYVVDISSHEPFFIENRKGKRSENHSRH
jgi:hypothetical protein